MQEVRTVAHCCNLQTSSYIASFSVNLLLVFFIQHMAMPHMILAQYLIVIHLLCCFPAEHYNAAW